MGSRVIAASKAKKRKVTWDDGLRKKRKSKPETWEDDGLLDLQAGLNRAFASMDSQLLSDYFSAQTSRLGSDLSSVELADLYIPGRKDVSGASR
jgi:protein CMS1